MGGKKIRPSFCSLSQLIRAGIQKEKELYNQYFIEILWDFIDCLFETSHFIMKKLKRKKLEKYKEIYGWIQYSML